MFQGSGTNLKTWNEYTKSKVERTCIKIKFITFGTTINQINADGFPCK